MFPIHQARCALPSTGGLGGVYIDESNLCIQGGKDYAKRYTDTVRITLDWGYHMAFLAKIIGKGFGFEVDKEYFKMYFKRYGSSVIRIHETFKALSHHVVEDKVCLRSGFNGREKQVDTKLAVDMVFEASAAMHLGTPCVFAVVSGDADMVPAVEKVAFCGYDVHVWSWEDSLSKAFQELLDTQSFNGGIYLLTLDEYWDDLTSSISDRSSDSGSLSPRRCWWRKYCRARNQCKYEHTPEEQAFFATQGLKVTKGYRFCHSMRTCDKDHCKYAHGIEEIFCPTCESVGEHQMKESPENKTA
ncbi:hypothetical protein ACLX1H_009049 [Fusarium chlamydosporum]